MTLKIDPLHTAGRQMMSARVVAKAISFSILMLSAAVFSIEIPSMIVSSANQIDLISLFSTICVYPFPFIYFIMAISCDQSGNSGPDRGGPPAGRAGRAIFLAGGPGGPENNGTGRAVQI